MPSKSHTDSNSSGQDPPRRRLRTPSSPGSSPQGARRSSPPRNHTAGWRPNRPCLKFYTGKQRMSPSKGGGGLLGRNRGEGYPPGPQQCALRAEREMRPALRKAGLPPTRSLCGCHAGRLMRCVRRGLRCGGTDQEEGRAQRAFTRASGAARGLLSCRRRLCRVFWNLLLEF